MRCSVILAAALASTALAAPSLNRGHAAAHLVARKYVYDVKTVTETVYVTEGEPTTTSKVTTTSHTTSTVYTPPPPPPPPSSTYTPPPPPPATTPAPAPAAVAAPKKVAPVPPTTSVYVAPVATTPAVVNTPANTGSGDGSPMSGGVSVLATANKYRAKYGLPLFKWSSKIAANAAKTGQDNGGVSENHELLDGSFGQVITPGLDRAVSGVNLQGFTPFELGYLSWMCEVSSDPQISASCPKMQSTMNMYYSSTGHYDILTSTSYTQIGCAFTQNPGAGSTSPYQGLWVCDVAF